MDKKDWFIFLILFLSACVSATEIKTAPFTLQHIGTTPDWEGLVSSWLIAYHQQLEKPNFQLDLLAPQEILSNLENGSIELAFIDREVPEGWFATPIKREAILVIANPKVGLTSLQMDDLDKIFSGRVKSWDIFTNSNDPIQPIVPLPGNQLREKFAKNFMKNSHFSPSAIIGSTPDIIIELVKSKAGAIGLLPAWRLEEGVNSIAIGGVAPTKEALDSGRYPLWVDILAISPEEPVGSIRDFLVWIQGTYLPSLNE